jgi:hypothetical protein
MRQSRSINRAALVCSMAALLASHTASAQQQAAKTNPDGAAEIARQAFIYGYPLVTVEVSRRVLTNVTGPTATGHAPVNQFGSLLAYPTAAFKEVVAPNVNTLYSSAFLDLSNEPVVVHMPDTRGRYYVMESLDAWTNVIASPGKRTTGTAAQNIAFVGPGWNGQLPGGVTKTVLSPTRTVWIVNRIQASGPSEYAVVNALQRQITATPASMFGTAYTPPPGTVDPNVDMKTPPLQQVNAMPADRFFTILARQLVANPPALADAPLIARMKSIGIVPGEAFSTAGNPTLAREVATGVKQALEAIEKHSKTMGSIHNGWQTLNMCGQYGTDYLTRAAVTMIGLGCNLPEDALYPTTTVDEHGERLSGANRYVLHFDAGQTPPANAFWSVTMYDASFFLVNNPANRYAVSSYDNLKMNPDGSLDLYVQHASPGADKAANWLPAPEGNFVLMARLYWPKPEAINGTWTMPGVARAP